VSPNPINFGYVPLELTAIGCTTVSNPCGASVSITGVGSFDTKGGELVVDPTDSFPIAISGGGNAQVCFSFTPPITEEVTTQATLITSEPNDSNPVVQLTGWGGGPEILCKPLTLAFGRVMPGQTSPLSVMCTNVGSNIPGLSLLIGPLDAGGGVFSAAFDADNNPYPDGGLQAGQGVQIDVTYAPVDDLGAFGLLPIPNNGGEKQTPYVSLSGDTLN
jgi:hypothetical protein